MKRSAHKTDFLAACKASDSRNKSLEEIRDKGGLLLEPSGGASSGLAAAVDGTNYLVVVADSSANPSGKKSACFMWRSRAPAIG